MLDDPHTHGHWQATAPAAPSTAALDTDTRAAVCVVGAGYTGLSAALHLAQRSIPTIVVDAREIGFGGAGRNVGLVNAGMWVMPNELPRILGEVYGKRLLKLLGEAPAAVFDIVKAHAIDCQLQTRGTLHCAVGSAGLSALQQREAQWLAHGAPVRLLAARETAHKVGSTAYAGALLDLRAGTIQPLAYARGLATAALAAGAQIHTHTPALQVTRAASGWQVKTPKGSVTADWVIMATDAYTQGPWEIIRREQVHLPYFNFATEPLNDTARASILPGGEGVWDSKTVMTSFRMDNLGRLIFGSIGALHGVAQTIHKDWALRALHSIFPQTGDVKFEAAWYGHIGMTDDNLPRLHQFAPNVIGVSGYNGRGIAPGTVMGRTLAELISGSTREADLPLPFTVPAEAKLRTLKEAFYEVGSQAVHFVDARI